MEKEKITEKVTKKRSEKVMEKKLKEKEQGTSKEANTAGKATELKEEGQEQLDDIKTSETKKTSKSSLRFGGYDPSVNYGCQNKMIKCYILHQMVYQFVFGHPDGTKPTIYEKSVAVDADFVSFPRFEFGFLRLKCNQFQ
ncbi:unnamed protein product [Anisakis simplex]|uniref:Uncharacterized protein n=1 Tax=Anisakis simplex TaxID=6269 RepID=A0A3P6RBD6_ANISI|nr:unnamed protein product [Anisakis simplex]